MGMDTDMDMGMGIMKVRRRANLGEKEFKV